MADKKKIISREEPNKPRGIFAEILVFATQHKKWWLTPIIVILVLVALLILLGGSGVAPFIYSQS